MASNRQQAKQTRTMYMHTLDGQPASYEERDGPYIYFVGGRHRVRPVSTLRELRRQQRAAIAASSSDWARIDRYSYVLVEVPA